MRRAIDNRTRYSYGFVCDASASARRNACRILASMPIELYFSRPSNSAFHTLCTQTKLPISCRSLLGLGLNFCLRSPRTAGTSTVDLTRFRRDAYTRMFFAHSPNSTPALFIRSNWEPPVDRIPIEFRARVSAFCRSIHSLFHRRKRSTPNLLPMQRAALRFLQDSDTFFVFKSDKNLGPVVLERSEYIRRALNEHLRTDTYRLLPEQTAHGRITAVNRILRRFIDTFTQPQSWERTFLERSLQVSDPFGYFYLLAKIHKVPWTTRPIVSVSGSLLHGLGRWVDFHLQKLCRQLPYVYRSSAMVVDRLRRLPALSPNTRLFTMDARSMYTNIDTPSALTALKHFFATSPYCSHLQPDLQTALLQALSILMTHNVFRFGNTYWVQTNGTAMGTPAAPMYATVVFAIREIEIIPRFQPQLIEYGRFIDDGFGIWQPLPTDSPATDAARWTEFQTAINQPGAFSNTARRLIWDFSPRSPSVSYLDLTINLHCGHLSTCLYEKALNLYLYLPPHSCHPPGVVKSLIVGRIQQIHKLTTRPEDRRRLASLLLERLHARGYSRSWLAPLFSSALRATTRQTPSLTPSTTPPLEKPFYFHAQFHPHDAAAREIQRAFRSTMLSPTDEPALPNLQNHRGARLNVSRLIVAYHRPRNLGNLLSPRRFRESHGASVSDLLVQADETGGTLNPT